MKYCSICPECGSYVYEPSLVPEKFRNIARFYVLMKNAQKPVFQTELERLRGMDDQDLIQYIMELAQAEYVRGFFHQPSRADFIPTLLKEKIKE